MDENKLEQAGVSVPPGSRPQAAARFRDALFWLAWMLFLISMVMPQGGWGSGNYAYEGPVIAYGLELAIIPFLAPWMLIMALASSLIFVAVAVIMSDFLFIASPILLRFARLPTKGARRAWLAYAILSAVCCVFFITAILTTPVVRQIDPKNVETKLLPGFVVWAYAQLTITVAAVAKLVTWGT